MRRLFVLLACVISAAIIAAQTPVVRSIQFRGFPISAEEILRVFKDKDIKLGVERVYDQQEVDRAKVVLKSLLEESGRSGSRVDVETHSIPPRSLEIVFTTATR